MIDLHRLVRLRRFSREAVPKPAGKPVRTMEPVKLVAITEGPAESQALQRIADSYTWAISIVASSDAAIAALGEPPTALVICDRDLVTEDWRDVLTRIASLPQAVCSLLASRVVDDYLWRQVIRHHGYDVVSKPFQPEELRRAVSFAWSWRGWAHRHYSEAPGKPSA